MSFGWRFDAGTLITKDHLICLNAIFSLTFPRLCSTTVNPNLGGGNGPKPKPIGAQGGPVGLPFGPIQSQLAQGGASDHVELVRYNKEVVAWKEGSIDPTLGWPAFPSIGSPLNFGEENRPTPVKGGHSYPAKHTPLQRKSLVETLGVIVVLVA